MFISFNRRVVCPDGQDVHSGQLQGCLHPDRGDIRNQHTQLRSVGMSQNAANSFHETALTIFATQVSRDVTDLRKLVSRNSSRAVYACKISLLRSVGMSQIGSIYSHLGDIGNQHTQLRSVEMSQNYINLFPEIAQGYLHPHRGDIRNQHTQLRSVGLSQICVNLFPEIASRLPTSSPERYSQPAYATQVSRVVTDLRELVSGNSFKAAYILTGEIFATSIRNSGQ